MKTEHRLLTTACCLLAALCCLLSASCESEEFRLDDSSVSLAFSADTISFDTVFATVGTATRRVTVYNRTSDHLRLSSVTLGQGRASRFRLNVDGDTSMVARNVEIEAGDSIFIFIQALINPNDAREPFLVEDDIRFSNGQRLPLTAWGRNAVYHVKPDGEPWSIVDCFGWTDTLPHVIVGPALVTGNNTLVLGPGAELYFADGAMLIIDSAARLIAQGSAENPVLFTSLRQDGWYRTLPGQWQTVWFYNYSTGNVIDHAVVENAVGAIRCYPNAQLRISNTVLRHHSDCAIIGQGADITGHNLLVHDCYASLTVLLGGSYEFSRCTFANYWNYSLRKIQTLVLSNCMNTQNGTPLGGDLRKADFRDCIVWGTFSEGELLVSALGGYAFDTSFSNTILRGGQWDEDPLFSNPREGDYTLRDDSPAQGIGYQF